MYELHSNNMRTCLYIVVIMRMNNSLMLKVAE